MPFDGVQRPLDLLAAQQGDWIARGLVLPALSRARRWAFTPTVRPGSAVVGGTCVGVVQETAKVEHRILIPPGISGMLCRIQAGTYTIEEPIGRLDGNRPLTLLQRWPVRMPRPVTERLPPIVPFITGQRVFDMLFPIASGGTVIVPGGFGTGKTVVEQTLAKYAQADIIIYVGCGERGNEMTEVLTEFPQLKDPTTSVAADEPRNRPRQDARGPSVGG